MTDQVQITVQIEVRGGVAEEHFQDGVTVAIRDMDNDDQPFTEAEIERAQAETRRALALLALVPKMEAALKDAAGAIDALAHEVGQMEGMFNDDDGTTADAKEAGLEAEAGIEAIRKALAAIRSA